MSEEDRVLLIIRRPNTYEIHYEERVVFTDLQMRVIGESAVEVCE